MDLRDLDVVCEKINREKEFLYSIGLKIWNKPELEFQEFFAHDLLTTALSDYGFEVTKNYLLPTGFKAEFSSKLGKGFTAAILLEYDALPEIGHGCGHNLIAEAGLAAGIAIKEALEKDTTLFGKVVLLGTPAEEGDGGKIEMVKEGAFNDIDFAMMVHPRNLTIYAPTALSMFCCTVDYIGKETHASASPWDGLNALDAAVLLYQSIGLLRQQMQPTSKLHAIITKGGTVPNIIPSETQVVLFLRATSSKKLNELKTKIDNCVEGAATSTGCSFRIEYDVKNYFAPLMSNPILCKIFGNFAEKLGLPECPTDVMEVLTAGSTDMGNVSQVVPAIHPEYEIGRNAETHTKEFAEASRSPESQITTLSAAKAMAMTVLTLFRNPDIMANVKEKFHEQQQK